MEYMAKAKIPHRAAGAHGAGVRGDQVNRGSRTFEGRFGRMFRALPAAEFDNGALEALAWAISAAPERQDPNSGTPGFSKPSASPETNDKFQDDEEGKIPSGYTYLGQFIDHDITFDPASSLQKQNDPDGLVDFRTPALDLDCVYGRGPEDQPYMYESNGKKFLLGRELTESGTPVTGRTVPRDLPRFRGDARARALIGDKRNDENVIVSQLQGVFLQFHNRLAGEMMTQNPDVEFKEIQRRVRWHYQYVVLNDFLPRIVGPKTMEKIWPNWRQGYCCDNQPNLCFYKFHDDPYIPIESGSNRGLSRLTHFLTARQSFHGVSSQRARAQKISKRSVFLAKSANLSADLLNWNRYDDERNRRRGLPAPCVDSPDQSNDLAPLAGTQ